MILDPIGTRDVGLRPRDGKVTRAGRLEPTPTQRPWPPGRPGGGRWGMSRTSRRLGRRSRAWSTRRTCRPRPGPSCGFNRPATPSAAGVGIAVQDRDLEDLTNAAETFGVLAGEDSEDDAAWYNHAVCLAWLGRNVEAVTSLERGRTLRAESQFERAVEAWTLAEVLRQGAARSNWPTTFAYSWMIEWSEEDAGRVLSTCAGAPAGASSARSHHRPAPIPGGAGLTWLDRPMPAATAHWGSPTCPGSWPRS